MSKATMNDAMGETMHLPLSNGYLFQVRFMHPLTNEDVDSVEKALALLVENMRRMVR